MLPEFDGVVPTSGETSQNRYPALWVAGALAAGILLAHAGMPGMAAWGSILTGLVGGAAAFCVAPSLHRVWKELRTLLIVLASLLLTVCFGGLRYATFHALPQDHPLLGALASGEETVWYGRIVDDPVERSGSVRFTLRLDQKNRGDGPPVGLLVSGRLTSGYDRQESWSPARCDRVTLRGRLASLPRARNPGEFDYGKYLFRKRIYARLYLVEGGVEHTGRDRQSTGCILEPARAFVQSSLDRFLPDSETRAILQALLLGDRRQLDSDTRDRFARMGLLHLLAVSGLHVMVVGMILYHLLGPFLYRLRLSWRAVDVLRLTCTVILLAGYMLLTGCSASVVRAVVMASLLLAATSLQRPSRSLNSLGAAVCVLLTAAPTHLFEAGFQLSVTAVAGIISLAPLLAVWIPAPASRLGAYIHSGTTVTVAATIGTLPVTLYHFGQVGLGGLLLNLPGIPLTTGALVAGAAAVVFGGIFPVVGEILGAASSALASALLHVSVFGDRFMGWSVVRWSLERPLPVLILALAGICLVLWPRPRLRWQCIALVLILLVGDVIQGVANGRYRPRMDVIYIDVGQGDAALLRLPNGDGVLIDAGPRSSFTGSDAGSRVVLPQLTHHGVDRLGTVIVTHPDSDHLGGIPSVLRSVPVGRVLRSGYRHSSRLFAETDALLDSLSIPHRAVRAGDSLMLSPQVRAYVLYPFEDIPEDGPNAHSVVLLVCYGEVSFLFTGDAPLEAELRMAQQYRELLQSDVLKVGHHGSRTSSTPAFLNSALGTRGPDAGAAGIAAADIPSGESQQGLRRPYAVVSVAERNRYGLPNQEILARLAATGFDVALTSKAGGVWFRTDGKTLRRVKWR